MIPNREEEYILEEMSEKNKRGAVSRLEHLVYSLCMPPGGTKAPPFFKSILPPWHLNF